MPPVLICSFVQNKAECSSFSSVTPRCPLTFYFFAQRQGAIAAHFSPISVHPNRHVSGFSGSKQGEMLPIFLQECCAQVDFAFCSQPGECCPFFRDKVSMQSNL